MRESENLKIIGHTRDSLCSSRYPHRATPNSKHTAQCSFSDESIALYSDFLGLQFGFEIPLSGPLEDGDEYLTNNYARNRE